MTRVACGQGAIEHLITQFETGDNPGWMTNSKRMDGVFTWDKRARVLQDISDKVGIFIQGPSTKPKAIKADFQ